MSPKDPSLDHSCAGAAFRNSANTPSSKVSVVATEVATTSTSDAEVPLSDIGTGAGGGVSVSVSVAVALRALTSAMPRSRDDVDYQEQRPTDAVGLLLLG